MLPTPRLTTHAQRSTIMPHPLSFLPPFRRLPLVAVVAIDGTTEVEVTSFLRGSPIYFHWFLNGVYLGWTLDGSRAFRLEDFETVRLEVYDTCDPAWDLTTFSSKAAPARRLLAWIRSLDPTTVYYRIEQQVADGAWAALAYVPSDDLIWQYTWTTEILNDLTAYAWRIVPINAASLAGTPIAISAEIIVRSPDAPDFTPTFNPIARTMQFST